MFPVTRQVRRKRTPVFGRPGRTRGARMRAMRRRRLRTGGGLGQKPLRSRSEAGLGQKQGWLAEREALEGESSVGRGRSKGWGESQGGLGERAGWRAREIARSPTSKTHRWPPDGQAAHAGLCRTRGRTPGPPGEPTMRSGRPRRRRRNAGADPLGHRSFMESA
jgi:hypothetical protein